MENKTEKKTMAEDFLNAFSVNEAEKPAEDDAEDVEPEKVSRFDDMYMKVMAKMEKKPAAQKIKLQKELMDQFLAAVSEMPMANRKLLLVAREFYRSGFLPGNLPK
jgi:HD-GYP domain-containing protein (c-di-GMP phosphodiesterase class II)